jgi:hypothetical protein
VFVIYVSKLAFFHDIPYAPWCWNIYQHLPHKWPSHVGKYTIHGAYGLKQPRQRWLAERKTDGLCV